MAANDAACFVYIPSTVLGFVAGVEDLEIIFRKRFTVSSCRSSINSAEGFRVKIRLQTMRHLNGPNDQWAWAVDMIASDSQVAYVHTEWDRWKDSSPMDRVEMLAEWPSRPNVMWT